MILGRTSEKPTRCSEKAAKNRTKMQYLWQYFKFTANELTIILLITTIVVFNLFYWSIKLLILERNVCLNIRISKYLVVIKQIRVDRGSETQPQVLENLNKLK